MQVSRFRPILFAALTLTTLALAQEQQRLAVVGKEMITDNDLLPYIQGQVLQLRQQEYDIKSKALENLINQRLLEQEAQKKNLTKEKFLEQEVDPKVPAPTEQEIQALYIVQKDQLNRTYDEIKPLLAQLLKQAKVQQARQDLFKSLREQAGVEIFLERPKVKVVHDPARLLGSAKAPVMIVEFSDFQCPYCRSVEPTLKKVLAKYGSRVAFSYRDLPGREIHPHAELAAQAARCAGDQGKFWEYHDHLFEHTDKLDRDGLIKYAGDLKLNEQEFVSCIATSKYREAVEDDRLLALRLGLNATPAFVINGNVLTGNLPEEAFVKAIETELAKEKKRASR